MPDLRPLVLAAAGVLAVGALTQRKEAALLAAGVALLASVGSFAAAWSAPVRALAALPGAILIAANPLVEVPQRWGPLLVVAVLMAAGAAVPDLCARWGGTGASGLLLAAGAAGAYACVPETDHLEMLAPAFLVLGVGEALVRRPLGAAVALGSCGLLGWAVLFGGSTRDGALVGGLACFGLLLLEPVARRLPGPGRAPVPSGAVAGAAVLGGLQAVYCAVASRTAGLRVDAVAAAVIVVPLALAVTITTRVGFGPVR